MLHQPDFQLTYAPLAWTQEREAWRAVIQLNLVRSVTLILDILSAEMQAQQQQKANQLASPSSPYTSPTISPPTSPLSTSPYGTVSALASLGADTITGSRSPGNVPSPIAMPGASPYGDDEEDDDAPPALAGANANAGAVAQQHLPPLAFTEHHRVLKLRLGPLRRVQKDLERRLGSGAEEPVHSDLSLAAAPFDDDGSDGSGYGHGGGMTIDFAQVTLATRRPQEFYVHSRTGWKSALEKLSIVGRHSTSSDGESNPPLALAFT